MSKINRGDRPLSPHLSIYRPQMTSVTSILVRITGNALILGALLIVWWLFAAATSLEHFAIVDEILTSFFGKTIMLGSIWALWYHTLGGVRHLIWDNAQGLDLETAYKLSWGIIYGSGFLTLLTVLIL